MGKKSPIPVIPVILITVYLDKLFPDSHKLHIWEYLQGVQDYLKKKLDSDPSGMVGEYWLTTDILMFFDQIWKAYI